MFYHAKAPAESVHGTVMHMCDGGISNHATSQCQGAKTIGLPLSGQRVHSPSFPLFPSSLAKRLVSEPRFLILADQRLPLEKSGPARC